METHQIHPIKQTTKTALTHFELSADPSDPILKMELRQSNKTNYNYPANIYAQVSKQFQVKRECFITFNRSEANVWNRTKEAPGIHTERNINVSISTGRVRYQTE